MLLRLVAEQGIVNANLGKEHQTPRSQARAGSQFTDILRLFLFPAPLGIQEVSHFPAALYFRVIPNQEKH